jgi:hypothetical protein
MELNTRRYRVDSYRTWLNSCLVPVIVFNVAHHAGRLITPGTSAIVGAACLCTVVHINASSYFMLTCC